MGASSSNDQILPELKKMILIKEEEAYSIYESQNNEQVEFWMFSSDESTYKVEQQILEEIKKANYGLARIINYRIIDKEKFFVFTNKCFCILTEHPRYSLKEYIKKYGNLNSKKVIDLTIQIVVAQKLLGKKSQYIGLDNIFTNDGSKWMLKPLLQTTSFFQILQTKKVPLQNSDDLLGFPAPEEFQNKVQDVTRVHIFNLGMILLQFILNKQSIDIYKNGKLDEAILKERKRELQDYDSHPQYTKNYLEIISSLIETSLERRPNYTVLSEQLQNSDLEKSSRVPLQGANEIAQLNGQVDCFKKGSVLKQQAAQIYEAVSKIEQAIASKLEEQKSKFYEKQNSIIIQQLNGTKYQGDLKNNLFDGEGKLYSRDDELLYLGEFSEGKFNGFGIQKFPKHLKLQNQYDYTNLKEMFKYVETYEGQFFYGIKQGIGKAYLSNGETFCGDFQNDLPDGCGAYVNRNQNIISGEWKKGELKQKIGVLQSNINPQIMSDPLNNNSIQASKSNQQTSLQQFNGLSKIESMMSILEHSSKQHRQFFLSQSIKQKPTQTQNLGDTIVCYEGEIVNQKMFGKGVLYFPNKKIQYEGDFLSGLFHGFGKLYNESPIYEKDIDIRDMRDIFTKRWWIDFEGEFNKGKKHGYGQLKMSNQSNFTGEFLEDQVHGEGHWRRDGKQDFIGIWECNILKSIIAGKL